MQIGFLIGRIILGLYLLSSGISGVVNQSMMAQAAASKGVPAASAAVIIAHLLLLVAGVCFLTGLRPHWGVVAMVIFFVPVTFIMHNFWAETSPQGRLLQMLNFTKNMAIMASSLMFLAIPRPWAYSLEARMRRRAPPPGALTA